MIRGFKCRDTEQLFATRANRRFSAIQDTAYRKLVMLHAATQLSDLIVPSGYRLEALHGDRRGQHSVRINARWRLCFVWRDGHADGVEIADYH